MTEEIEPHIYKKFEILQKLGKGAYGIVWKAVERKTKQVVAVKKVFDAFHNDTDAQRTFREVMILQELDHENMIKLYNVIKAENNKDLYLIFEYMETDLHAVIRAGILEEIHKVYIVYQILKSLLYLHTGGIIHRDLKPSNVLINSECLVKIADFGLARSIQSYDDETAPIMTEYVATRWYRAPEIVLGSTQYSKAVDMWSVGCILGELIVGKAIFPGKSTINQIELILDLLGKPKPDDLEAIGGANDWNIINSINTKQKYTYTSFFRGASKHAIDFLKRCLEFNPKKRISVEEALKHPFVEQFHSPKDEKVCAHLIEIPISDQKKLSIKEYREALYADILKKKKEQRKKWQMAYLKQLGIKVTEEDRVESNFMNIMKEQGKKPSEMSEKTDPRSREELKKEELRREELRREEQKREEYKKELMRKEEALGGSKLQGGPAQPKVYKYEELMGKGQDPSKYMKPKPSTTGGVPSKSGPSSNLQGYDYYNGLAKNKINTNT
jgi:mitogen-activated protein kinase 15